MHRTLNGFFILALIVFSVLIALVRASAGASSAPVMITLVLLVVSALGVLAIRALMQHHRRAQALVVGWAAAILAHFVLEDVAAGFGRPGLQGRLLATVLVAAVLAAVVVSAKPTKTERDAADASLA